MMSLHYYLLIFINSLIIIVPWTSALDGYLGWKCVAKEGNYSTNSSYESNLLGALSSLNSLSSTYSFSTATGGERDDDLNHRVYTLFDCRGDVSLPTCRECVQNASATLLQICPLNKEALITYQECILRYANRPILGTLEQTYPLQYWKLAIPEDGGEMNRTMGAAIGKLIDEATSETSPRYFAMGTGRYFGHQNLYSYVQCTSDLSRAQCKECLMYAYNFTVGTCATQGMLVGYYSGPNCRIVYTWRRFSNSSTLNPTVAPPPPPPLAGSPPPIKPPRSGVSRGGHFIISNPMLMPLFISIFFVIVHF